MVEAGLPPPASRRSGCCRCPAPTTPRSAQLAKQLADRYEDTNVSLSLPSTRVDAFNIDLANEFSRNGRRSGLTFAPEGGSERMRRVINKMVSQEDLIRTVAAAYSQGWRQVKLYFMCGLPTETDEDVLEIADHGPRRDPGRPARPPAAATSGARSRSAGSCPSRTPRSSGPPRPPRRWSTTGCASCATAINADRSLGRNIGMRYHDGQPSLIEGLLCYWSWEVLSFWPPAALARSGWPDGSIASDCSCTASDRR